jgi:lantibiotic modifying enzyme
VLFSPSRHEPLGDSRWSEARARRAIAAIAESTEAGFDSGIGLWPLHAYDREPGSDHPMRSVYLGASGIIWALAQLAADGSVDLVRDYGSVAERLEPEMVVEPDESAEWPADGFLGGRCGALAVAQRHRDAADRADLLLRLMAGGIQQPALELFYGAPGMMVLAAAEHARTRDVRFADVWRASARHVLEQWHIDEELGVRLWTQQLTPQRTDRFVGFGHGLAGNAFALLRGDLLEPDERGAVEVDAVAAAKRLAIVDGDHANWPPLLDAPLESSSGIRTQWCHGAPGVIIALARACLDDDAWSELLLAGGRTTWDAGPLRDRAGLCHGTAGNAYAFLALWQRTSDELWLERARSFAKHALDQVERESLPWHSLFTGDLGVALCLRSCLETDARFPALDWF